jgi:hypothetical protein
MTLARPTEVKYASPDGLPSEATDMSRGGEAQMASEAASQAIVRRGEQLVLWGAFPVLVVCFAWLLGTSRPLVPAVTMLLVFGLSMGVQVRRALRREGVEREIMLRAAAISYPIVTTVLFAALIADLSGAVEASTSLAIAMVVAVVVQTAVEGLLTWRLG